MRIFRSIGLVFVVIVVMLGIAYGTSFLYMKLWGENDQAKFQEQFEEKNMIKVENYNKKEGSILEVEETMPVEYIGMDRQTLTAELRAYEEAPSIADLEGGFESYQVISFSNEQVVLRKTFSPPSVAYKYYLTEQNGCVIVYYIDKKTVFEYTSIMVDSLPEELQRQLEKGKYITDIDSLYDFLETYSS